MNEKKLNEMKDEREGMVYQLIGTSPRVSYSMSYKNLIVFDKDPYHPEKMDITISKTLDVIPGECEADTLERLKACDDVVELLKNNVGQSLADKVKSIKLKTIKTKQQKQTRGK